MKLTEQFILLQAPNAAAAENGRKLSKKGNFFKRFQTEDSTLYWAECVGSGKNPYRTSIDFSVSESAPTGRCSCPSRQFPCKHTLGLMFEMLEEKDFATAQIPADIADKREKQAARTAKKECLVCAASGALTGLIKSDVVMPKFNMSMVFTMLCAIGVGVYTLSWLLSIRFYQKREIA